jgi:hypothetical protein
MGVFAFSVLLVAARIYANRTKRQRRITWSDYILAIAVLLLIIPTVLSKLTIKPASDIKVLPFRLKVPLALDTLNLVPH